MTLVSFLNTGHALGGLPKGLYLSGVSLNNRNSPAAVWHGGKVMAIYASMSYRRGSLRCRTHQLVPPEVKCADIEAPPASWQWT